MDMTLPSLIPDISFGDQMIADDFLGYREMARSIVLDAVRDILKWNQRRPMRGPQFNKAQDSMRFLFSSKHKHIRALWLSWLDMDDAFLQQMAEQKGFKSMIAEVCDE